VKKPTTRFKDLSVHEYFVFADRDTIVCKKTGPHTYEVVETGQQGMVGVGDNNVVRSRGMCGMDTQ
jgi:hypothetical protein